MEWFVGLERYYFLLEVESSEVRFLTQVEKRREHTNWEIGNCTGVSSSLSCIHKNNDNIFLPCKYPPLH